MPAIPKTWLEFIKGGTAIRRTGYLNGTWMDPEDAKPRRALVYYEWTNSTYKAWVNKKVDDCGGDMWEGTIRVGKKYLHGIITVGVSGYEFTWENPKV